VKDHFAEVIIFVAGATQACQFNRESPLSRFALLSSPPNQTKTYSARNNEQSIQSDLLFLEAAEADEIRIFRKALFYPYQFGWFLKSSDFRANVVAATNKFCIAKRSIVDIDPSFATASVSHPDLRFLTNEKAFLWIDWVKFFISIKGLEYACIGRQSHQLSMNHPTRRRIKNGARKFTKVVESSTNVPGTKASKTFDEGSDLLGSFAGK